MHCSHLRRMDGSGLQASLPQTRPQLTSPSRPLAPCPTLYPAQAPVRLHAYGVGRGVDREELLRIISASDADTAEDRWVHGVPSLGAPS